LEKTLLGSLLIPTTIPIIVQLMSCAGNGVNPAPQDGSAPNLVVVDRDKFGRPYYK